MNIYKSVEELAGNTPLLELASLEKEYNLKAKIFAKLESFNPAGSAKDRVAIAMIKDAEDKGLLKEGSVIIEPTSGNTGIGLACYGIKKGYRVILTMPDTMSIERRNLLKAYGAEIMLTNGESGMAGSIKKAEELAKDIKGSFIPSQFTNKANPKAHYLTTGPEIYKDTDGLVDIFVAGVGTGGTLSGAGKFLKEQNPLVKVIAAEPFDSPLISEGKSGPHKLQGIGANFIPETLDKSIIDEVIKVTTEDAFKMGRHLARREGILSGISSGAALFAALTVATREENKEKNIVVILPDTGERYLSSEMFI